jgi:quinoprotein glucose dehydrogenase
MSKLTLVATIFLLHSAVANIQAQTGELSGEWHFFGGDSGSTKYSSLDLIDKENVANLEIAWRWESVDGRFNIDQLKAEYPNLQVANDVSNVSIDSLKAAPLMVDGVIYISTPFYQAAAIDAANGETLWVHDPRSYASGIPIMMLGFSSRGLAYWSEGEQSRVIWGTGDGYLLQVDAVTGEPIEEFGNSGRVDLIAGIPRARRRAPINYSITSSPIIIRDVIVVGSAISDQPEYKEMLPGHVRGFDVHTGELLWTFHTIPQPGELGNDTWENGSWEYSGHANVWTLMSADEETGYVYLPVGSPTNDFYGGHRLGDNLFANSLVALDATTGKRVWHYQFVHHDIWDSDLPAAPNLIDITVDENRIKAVAQVTKHGFVFVFDRVTGEPVWPIEERAVSVSDVPGERASETQPFPTKPPAFDRQGLTIDDLIDFTPELRQEAISIVERHRYGPMFTPPSLSGEGDDATQGTINVPGYIGGANWEGAAADPETGILYVPSATIPSLSGMVEPQSSDATLNYVRNVTTRVGPQGLPLTKPPYGRITAIDLNKGEILWQEPNGIGSPQVRSHPGLAGVELPPLGGGLDLVLVTKTLLLSAQPTPNESGFFPLVARDKLTGEVIAEVELPGRAIGPPVTYLFEGEQYIGVTVRGTPPELVVLNIR